MCGEARTEGTGDRPHFASLSLKDLTGSMARCLVPGSLSSIPSYPVVVPDPFRGKRVVVVKNV